mgnify:CR=1 FL=1
MQKLSVASSNVKWPLAAVTKHSAESWESVTERLEKLRCVMRLNKKQFAESVGMTPQNWGNVMKGRSMLPVSVAIRACLLTGADLDYIYRGDAAGLAPRPESRPFAAPEPQRRKLVLTGCLWFQQK